MYGNILIKVIIKMQVDEVQALYMFACKSANQLFKESISLMRPLN